ncbi:sporulation protein [Nocardia sp. NPDC005366]|uniref:sporulation protein n=1 Tax=Nocardia sp. NPDC005366 TaxID=3156878 RepID=UPI0033A3E92F
MKIDELMTLAKDSLTVRRVYSDPVESGGLTIIEVAAVSGGGGAGVGSDKDGGQGSGGGFGLGAKPVGVYVIKDGRLTWQPAVDVNRLAVIVGAVTVTVTALLVGARIANGVS